MNPHPIDLLNPNTVRTLSYARKSGYVLGAFLIVSGLFGFLGAGNPSRFESFKDFYFVLYGIVLCLPFARISDQKWWPCYIILVVFSLLFVFVMIAVVMFAYMAADERGERLGVPGVQGTLIFFALLQIPVVLFQQKPDLLN